MDEIQSGIGRTGTMYACQQPDGTVIEPDVLCIGKGLASGLPLAGIVAKAELMSWQPGGHGSTFGGNPVACAAAVAAIELVEASLAANARPRRAAPRRPARAGCPPAAAARCGRGLMIGLDLPDHDTAEALQEALFRRGLLSLTCGERTMRLAPRWWSPPSNATLPWRFSRTR